MIKQILAHFPTYRIRHGYGLEPIRNKREAKALYDFCQSWLDRTEGTEERDLNPERAEIYEHTIKLYEYEFKGASLDDDFVHCHCPSCKNAGNGQRHYNFYDYIENHCAWYWD